MAEQSTEPNPPVAAGIIVREGRVLMVRRRVTEDDLVWQFPAGKVEPGETVEETAARETREETGLTVQAVTVLGERIHPATGRTITYVACNPLAGEAHAAAPREVAEVAWVPLDRLGEHVTHELYGPVRDYLVEQTMTAYRWAFDAALRGTPERAARLAELERAVETAETREEVTATGAEIHRLLNEVAAELAPDWPQIGTGSKRQ